MFDNKKLEKIRMALEQKDVEMIRNLIYKRIPALWVLNDSTFSKFLENVEFVFKKKGELIYETNQDQEYLIL